MKRLFLAILFLITVSANAQWTEDVGTYNAGVSYGYHITLDSLTTSVTSPYIDWTICDGQTVYFTYSLVQAHFNAGAGNDTIQVILQGINKQGIVFNLDTLGAGSAGSEIIVSGLTLSAQAGQVTISPVKYMPMIRFLVSHKNTGANVNMTHAVFYGSVYSRVNDTYIADPKIQWK